MSTNDTNPDYSPQALRSLLRPGALDRVRRDLRLAGFGEASDALLADVPQHATYLERCVREAEAVLHGDLRASTRLWLLLNEVIDAGPALPTSVLDEIAAGARREAPRTIDGDVLLRLIAGVVRAANNPVEAEAMLDALGRLLRPLFVLEIAAAAAGQAGQGDTGALATLVTARLSPQWRASLTRTPDPAVTRDPSAVAKPVLDDRLPFDPASWRDPTVLKPTVDRWELLWTCIGGTLVMSEIDRFGERYAIDSISNPQQFAARARHGRSTEACPGQSITIRGRNFGSRGRVMFPFPEPTDPAFALGGNEILIGVEPTRWTDTEVDVVVPPWATTGELRLAAFTHHVDVCATIDVYRLGNSILFLGGLAKVFKVYIAAQEIDPSSRPPNLTPGDAVALTWRATNTPTVRIKIQLMDGATVLWERTDLPGGFGGVVLSVPDPEPHQPRNARLVFTAASECGATQPLNVPVLLSVPPRLTIQYVEVTQGVQGDLADVLAGRSMPTVANKDTAVRVHINCDRGGWYDNKLDRITGALLVDGRMLAPTNVRLVPPADRGYASVQGLSNPEHTNDTLNFLIPAAWLTPGTHTLTVRLVCNDPSGLIVLSQNVNWTWVAKSPFRVRALYMALDGTTEFMLDYTRRALDYLPTPLTDIGIAAPVWYPHTYDLSTNSGWLDLLDDLENAWDDADEESGVRWLGIVPASERFRVTSLAHQGISGAPSIAALAMGDRPYVGAHELGHTYGLHHIHLPAGGPNEPAGPYDPADGGGMLRRPPFDVRTSTAIPLPAADLMTYFEPVRPGISTWMRLFLNT
jgi:hypothetical protein